MIDEPEILARRRMALSRYAVLDTEAEAEFDAIVQAASAACGMPVSLISLLDENRQWFKAETGFGRSETPLTSSICTFAVEHHDLFEIPDTAQDVRTATNPLVTGDPHVRFYAGVPLETAEGVGIGALCVLDTKPNRLTAPQALILRTLARQAMTALELRRALKERRESDRRNAAVLESAIDYAIVTLDMDGRVTGWNKGAERILGWSEAEMAGQPAHAFFTEEDVRDGIPEREMGSALTQGRGADERWHRRKDDSRFWASGETMVLRDENDATIGFLKMLRDRTEQRRAAEAIRAQTDLLRTITDHVGQAIFQLDGDGRITFGNPAAVAMFGWSPEEMTGRSLHDLLHHSHPDGSPYRADDCTLRQALVAGRLLTSIEETFFRRDRTPVRVEVTSAPVHVDGQVVHAIVTVSDITARKAGERRIDLLAQASSALLSADDPAAALGPILEAGARELGFDQSYTYDLTEDGRHLALSHSVGADEPTRAALRRAPFSLPLCGIVAETGRPFVLRGLQANSEPRYALARDGGLQAYAGFPIRSHGALRGVISFGSTVTTDFDDDTLAFFGTVTRFLSIARERLDGEAALRAGERRWRGLFEGIQEGFFLGELIRDGSGRAVDYRYLEINPAFTQQSGLPEDSAGRTVRELVPDLDPWVVDSYARVVETGVAETFEADVPALGRVFEVRAHREQGDRFGCLFLDITARKGGERRLAALAELGDRLRDLNDKPEIARAAALVMAKAFDASHTGYGAIDADAEAVLVADGWTAPGLASVAGRHAFRTYGSYIEDLRAGRDVAIADVAHDARTSSDTTALGSIGVSSILNLPVMERGRFVGLFYVLDGKVHPWTAEEITFVRAVADRTRAALARVEAEEEQHVLNQELSHRMKNTLTLVQSIASQTLRNAGSVIDARTTLAARLIALGRSHDILLSGRSDTAAVTAVIDGALTLHQDQAGRFRTSGPELRIGPSGALSLSLMLHELATNATKYGALSRPEGSVEVVWSVRGEGEAAEFHLRWSERGGPPVTPPSRHGFGSRLIERGLAGGSVALDYRPEGVTCMLTTRVAAMMVER